MTTVYDYDDYKPYLLAAFAKRAPGGRGERIRLANAIGCNNTYVSQVLNGSQHFSLEQAELINRYLSHTSDEARFFLDLVSMSRAGTPGLRRHFASGVLQARKKRKQLKHRLEFKKALGPEAQSIYYGNWYYAAIHVLLSVPGYDTPDTLARHLSLPKRTVAHVLDYLVQVGLALEKGGRYGIGDSSIHLAADSPMIHRHHANWHLRAIDSLDRASPEDLHYSSVVTISREDRQKVKDILVRAIEEVRTLVRGSKEEAAHCYKVDFFGIGQD